MKELNAPARIEMDGVFNMQSFKPKTASSFFTVTYNFKELNLRATIHRQLQSESH